MHFPPYSLLAENSSKQTSLNLYFQVTYFSICPKIGKKVNQNSDFLIYQIIYQISCYHTKFSLESSLVSLLSYTEATPQFFKTYFKPKL